MSCSVSTSVYNGDYAPPYPTGALYWNGNQVNSITGGWSIDPNTDGYTMYYPILASEKESTYIHMPVPPNSNFYAMVTKQAIDLSRYNYLNVELDRLTGTYYFGIYVTPTKRIDGNAANYYGVSYDDTIHQYDANAQAWVDMGYKDNHKWVKHDFSGIDKTQDYYIAVGVYNDSSADVYGIWLSVD